MSTTTSSRGAGYDPTRKASRQARAFAMGVGAVLRPTLDAASKSRLAVRVARPLLDQLASHQGTADGIELTPFRRGTVRGLWLQNRLAQEEAPRGKSSRGRSKEGPTGRGTVLLYLHGGAFVVCSPQTHKGLVSRLCKESGSSALLLDYQLAPERPFPTAPMQALAAYRLLLDAGYSPARITVAGDSAGGHLVAHLLRDLHGEGLPMPAAVLLMSPFLDLTSKRALTADRFHRDPFVPPQAAARVGRMYAGELDAGHKALDVLHGDKAVFQAWPPTLIQVGGTECLRSDSERLSVVLKKAGVDVTLQIWPGMVHVWQAYPAVVPEAVTAVQEAGRFLREATGARGSARTA